MLIMTSSSSQSLRLLTLATFSVYAALVPVPGLDYDQYIYWSYNLPDVSAEILYNCLELYETLDVVAWLMNPNLIIFLYNT